MANVLIVDDDGPFRETLRLALEERGYTAVPVTDGSAALELLRAIAQPHVVLLDLRMPGLDGMGVLQAVSDGDPALARHAYILLTADQTLLDEIRKSPVASVPVATVQKPFMLNTLYDVVAQAARTLKATNEQAE